MLPSTLGNTVQLDTIPQGRSSRMDSDTLDGFQTSPANNPSPGTIVPLGMSGQFNPSVIPPITGTYSLVQSQPVTAVSAVNFTTPALMPGVIYRLDYIVRQNTSNAKYSIRFNGDSGANYSWSTNGYDATNAIVHDGNSGATSGFLMSQPILAGKAAKGEIEFSTDPSDSTATVVTTKITYWDAAGFQVAESGGVYYMNTALSSFNFLASAGTITGTLNLQRIS